MSLLRRQRAEESAPEPEPLSVAAQILARVPPSDLDALAADLAERQREQALRDWNRRQPEPDPESFDGQVLARQRVRAEEQLRACQEHEVAARSDRARQAARRDQLRAEVAQLRRQVADIEEREHQATAALSAQLDKASAPFRRQAGPLKDRIRQAEREIRDLV